MENIAQKLCNIHKTDSIPRKCQRFHYMRGREDSAGYIDWKTGIEKGQRSVDP